MGNESSRFIDLTLRAIARRRQRLLSLVRWVYMCNNRLRLLVHCDMPRCSFQHRIADSVAPSRFLKSAKLMRAIMQDIEFFYMGVVILTNILCGKFVVCSEYTSFSKSALIVNCRRTSSTFWFISSVRSISAFYCSRYSDSSVSHLWIYCWICACDGSRVVSMWARISSKASVWLSMRATGVLSCTFREQPLAL